VHFTGSPPTTWCGHLVGHIVAAYGDYEARREDDRGEQDGEAESRRPGPRKGRRA
jgi:hypothetical protein